MATALDLFLLLSFPISLGYSGLLSPVGFPTGNDVDGILVPKYRKTYESVISGAEALSFAALGLGDEDVRRFLSQVKAGHCHRLKKLDMGGNKKVTVPLEEWAEALSSGAPQLEELDLKANYYMGGDVGSLSSLVNLKVVDLKGTKGTGDMGPLSSLLNLEEAWLNSTAVHGDLAAFSGLTKLRRLNVSSPKNEDARVTGDKAALEAAIPGIDIQIYI